MRREDRGSVGEGLEVAAGGADGAETTDEFDTRPLFHFFRFAQEDCADLSGTVDVGATTGVQVEVANINQSQLFANCRRNLADSHSPRLVGSSEADLDGTVLGDDLV